MIFYASYAIFRVQCNFTRPMYFTRPMVFYAYYAIFRVQCNFTRPMAAFYASLHILYAPIHGRKRENGPFLASFEAASFRQQQPPQQLRFGQPRLRARTPPRQFKRAQRRLKAITTICHTHLDEEAQGDAVAFKQQYQLSEELEKAWPIGGLFPCVPLWGGAKRCGLFPGAPVCNCIRMRQELIRQQREEHKGFVLELERNTQFVHQLKCTYICFHPTTNASSFICWLGLNK
ncbi:hypothetical protein niasHT_032491 [Heterodera trifolii]|uniref:Uncharacterized protein n=1 Tax=Heterodera trifolii TaxID=157864 RepID=A0ABD2IRL3_9BILA